MVIHEWIRPRNNAFNRCRGPASIAAILLILSIATNHGVAGIPFQVASPESSDGPRSAPRVVRAEIQAMLDAIVEAILERHHPTRHWEPIRPPADQSAQPTGRTALAVLALLDAGMPAQSRRIAESIEWMSVTPADGTYAIAVRLMVWCRLPGRDRERRIECDRLLERFSLEGGGWDYGPTPRLGFVDQSLTQFALQAIAEAARRSIEVPRPIFERVRSRLLATQNPDGGWGYRRRGDPARGSMTAAGIASLALIERQAGSDRQGRRRVTDATARAMRWLSTRFDVEANPGCPRWHLYWIHALERAASVTGLRRIATRDWFEDAAAMIRRRLFLVERRVPPAIRGTPRLDRLAFAALVLRRGLEPVAFACLDLSESPPIDDLLGKACRLVSERVERETGWIRIEPNDPPHAWDRFPVLVVRSPPRAAWLDSSASAIAVRLAAFAASGGLVIALPDSTPSGVRTFPRRAIEAIVPADGIERPEAVERADPVRRRVGRWRLDARQAGSPLRRWCVSTRVPLLPPGQAVRIDGEMASMLASLCLERTAGLLPGRIPAAIADDAGRPDVGTTPGGRIRRIDWGGAGRIEPGVLNGWRRLAVQDPIADRIQAPIREPSQEPIQEPPASPSAVDPRTLVWLTGTADSNPAELGGVEKVFDRRGEFLLVEALSPGFRTNLIEWIRAAGWRVGLPPAGAPATCAGIHAEGRCVGVIVDDRPARRLLGIRTPADFSRHDLSMLHRSVRTALVADR